MLKFVPVVKTEISLHVVKCSVRLADILRTKPLFQLFMKNAHVRPCFIVHCPDLVWTN